METLEPLSRALFLKFSPSVPTAKQDTQEWSWISSANPAEKIDLDAILATSHTWRLEIELSGVLVQYLRAGDAPRQLIRASYGQEWEGTMPGDLKRPHFVESVIPIRCPQYSAAKTGITKHLHITWDAEKRGPVNKFIDGVCYMAQLSREAGSVESIQFSVLSAQLQLSFQHAGDVTAFHNKINSGEFSFVEGMRMMARYSNKDETKVTLLKPPAATVIHEPSAIEGIDVILDFITPEEEEYLIKYTDENCWIDNIQRRRVQHFGFEFNYQLRRLDVSKEPTAFPEPYQIMSQKLKDLGFFPSIPTQLTLNDYQPGQGIRFHVDSHSSFMDEVASISLGSDCVMEFRMPLDDISIGKHRVVHTESENTTNILLPRRSLLVMRGRARYLLDHQIPDRKTDTVVDAGYYTLQKCAREITRYRRISVTFRRARMDGVCICPYPMQCDSQKLFTQDPGHR